MDDVVETTPTETRQRRRRKSRHSAAKRRKKFLRWVIYVLVHIVVIAGLIYLWYALTDHDPGSALTLL